MHAEMDQDRTIEFDAENVVDGVTAQLAEFPKLSPAHKRLIERTIRRYTELRLEAIRANSSQLRGVRQELTALKATLSTLGEVVANRMWAQLSARVIDLLIVGLKVVL